MVDSANTRIGRRTATSHRISVCAQRLAEERGFDGFTMDDLAEAAGVSRRTLFNYYSGKVDATLGAAPGPGDELLAEFRAGGPTGDLVADLVSLAKAVQSTAEFDRADEARSRRLLLAEPRLLAAAHERIRAITEEFVDEIRAREGEAFDERRARVAIRMIALLFEMSLDEYLTDPDESELVDIFTATVQTARELLA